MAYPNSGDHENLFKSHEHLQTSSTKIQFTILKVCFELKILANNIVTTALEGPLDWIRTHLTFVAYTIFGVYQIMSILSQVSKRKELEDILTFKPWTFLMCFERFSTGVFKNLETVLCKKRFYQLRRMLQQIVGESKSHLEPDYRQNVCSTGGCWSNS